MDEADIPEVLRGHPGESFGKVLITLPDMTLVEIARRLGLLCGVYRGGMEGKRWRAEMVREANFRDVHKEFFDRVMKAHEELADSPIVFGDN